MSQSEDRFEPVHAAHAIEQVVFSIQLTDALTAIEMQSLRAASEELKDVLPGIVDLRLISVGIGQGASGHGGFGGFIRQVSARDASIERELVVEEQNIRFRTVIYTRWDDVFQGAKDVLVKMLAHVPQRININAVTLQYYDKFIWQGDEDSCAAQKLLDEKSSYLSPQIFHATDLWHSHTGMFCRKSDEIKSLRVVNVDCVDEVIDGSQKRVVKITTALTEILNQDKFKPLSIPASSAESFLNESFNSLHSLAKDVLASLLIDSSRKIIGLED